MSAPAPAPLPELRIPLWSRAPQRPLLWLLLITAGSILTQGYLVGFINHGLQIPLIRHWAGDDAFDRDPFISDLVNTYTTAFFPAVGYAARYVPLPVLMFALFLAFRFATCWLGWRLGMVLFDDGVAALWTAAVLAVQSTTFGWDIVSEIYLTHGALAQVMALWALLLVARRRIVAAWVVLGVLFNFHGMHAVHLMLVLGLVQLPLLRDRALRGQVILGGVVAVLLSLPTLWWMREVGALGGTPPAGYAQAIKDWFPSHFWPSTWGMLDWLMLLFPVATAWPLWALAQPTQPVADAGTLARMVWLSILVAMVGGVLVEIHPHPFILRLHLMRLSWIMALAGAPFLARACVQLVRAVDRPDLPDARMAAATGVMMLMGLGVAALYRPAYWLTLAPALWMVLRYRGGQPGGRMVALMTALAVAIPGALTLSGVRELPVASAEAAPRGFYFIEGLFGLFAAVAVLSAWIRRAEGPHRGFTRRMLFQAACLLAALHLGARGVVMTYGPRKGAMSEWRDVQEWCARTLPRGDVVMVPLTQMGLRVFSNQIPAVDFQEGDAAFHHPAYVETFQRKLRLYGWEPAPIVGFTHFSRLDPLDERLTDDDARRLGREFGAHVAIRRTRHPPWNLPELYRTPSFVIYRLDDVPPPS
ncbi:MAG: hypothetical protein HY904_12170 [Deltaproteobacteria bacterium]|nr:hypothetical protein [Deltaproteobacteria bacterium]